MFLAMKNIYNYEPWLTMLTTRPAVSWSTAAATTMRGATEPTIVPVTRLWFSQMVGTGTATGCALCHPPRPLLCTTCTALVRARAPTRPATDLAVTGRRRPSTTSSSSPAENEICFHKQNQDTDCHQSSSHDDFFSTESFLDDVNLLLNFLVPSLWRASLQMESRNPKQRTLCRKKFLAVIYILFVWNPKVLKNTRTMERISRFSLLD